LATDQPVKIGPQIDRVTSCPEGGPTSLLEFVK
jgi:NADH-quinone oxidoreductase subunit E